MQFSKITSIAIIALCAIVLVACNCTKSQSNDQGTMTLSQPSFITKTVYYNTFSGGTPQAGTGYELQLENIKMPDNMMLRTMYFNNASGKVYPSSNGYTSRVLNTSNDVIMDSDVNNEASNTPPTQEDTFPFDLAENEAGIAYTEDGEMKYAIFKNLLQREPIYYPSAPPKSKNQ